MLERQSHMEREVYPGWGQPGRPGTWAPPGPGWSRAWCGGGLWRRWNPDGRWRWCRCWLCHCGDAAESTCGFHRCPLCSVQRLQKECWGVFQGRGGCWWLAGVAQKQLAEALQWAERGCHQFLRGWPQQRIQLWKVMKTPLEFRMEREEGGVAYLVGEIRRVEGSRGLWCNRLRSKEWRSKCSAHLNCMTAQTGNRSNLQGRIGLRYKFGYSDLRSSNEGFYAYSVHMTWRCPFVHHLSGKQMLCNIGWN